MWVIVSMQARQTADLCSLLQAHEEEGCSFPANITDRANLTVAGQALTALDGSNLFGSHGTVFLPNDAAFTALLTALGELPCTQTPARVAAPPAGLLARTFVSDQVVIPLSETVPGDAGRCRAAAADRVRRTTSQHPVAFVPVSRDPG